MATNTPKEVYALAGDPDTQQMFNVRRAAQWVGFFLPHLKPGLSVLDCGCGQGSITLDLAELVAPGHVVGVDMDQGQLAIARQAAMVRGVTNVSFHHGNAYELPFVDASFDAVLAHTLLFHLSDRGRALREFRRVLKPGGMVAVSDDNLDTFTMAPEEPAVRKFMEISIQRLRFSGGDPTYSPQLRGLLLQAGFVKTEGHAVAADSSGTLAETRRWARFVTQLWRNPIIVQQIIDQGWASQTEIDQILDGIQHWAERPDAFLAVMYCAAIGWNA